MNVYVATLVASMAQMVRLLLVESLVIVVNVSEAWAVDMNDVAVQGTVSTKNASAKFEVMEFVLV